MSKTMPLSSGVTSRGDEARTIRPDGRKARTGQGPMELGGM